MSVQSESSAMLLCSARSWCAGYLKHPRKKEAHGDERSGFTLLADGLIPEGTSSRNACARWLCTSISSAQKELQERDPTKAPCRLCERMSEVTSTMVCGILHRMTETKYAPGWLGSAGIKGDQASFTPFSIPYFSLIQISFLTSSIFAPSKDGQTFLSVRT
jgi:hypothetical protein